jgi:Protein of unknown function (DUF3179)
MSENPPTSTDPTPEVQTRPAEKRATDPLIRALAIGAILVVSVVAIGLGMSLWREWRFLRLESDYAELNTVIGYPNVAPILTFAQRPKNWFHEEGNEALLWSEWVSGVGHRWYHFAPGEIDKSKVIMPRMHNRARAIDYPVVEIDDGEYWRKIPAKVQVVGCSLGGQSCAYPVPVLVQVQVINDLITDHAYLITLNLMAPAAEAFSVFDPVLEGHRLTMAPTGYFLAGKPLLCDRGTSSLWCEDRDSLRAVTGKYKGQKLPRLARPVPVAWQSWCSENPHCRLVVGADRSHSIPVE